MKINVSIVEDSDIYLCNAVHIGNMDIMILIKLQKVKNDIDDLEEVNDP